MAGLVSTEGLEEVGIFDEFLEIWERPMDRPVRPVHVHTEEAPLSVECETTRTYRHDTGVKVAVTYLEREGTPIEDVRAALEAAVGELESDMEAKERAFS